MLDPAEYDGHLSIWRDQAGVHTDISAAPQKLIVAAELVAEAGSGQHLILDIAERRITLRFIEGDLTYEVQGKDDVGSFLYCDRVIA